MPIINVTPHDIHILHQGARPKESWDEIIPASGQVARCEIYRKQMGILKNIPIFHLHYGIVQGLPSPQKGTFYIVSSIVAQAMKQTRNDLLVPVDFVRDDKGNIIGCQALGCLADWKEISL